MNKKPNQKTNQKITHEINQDTTSQESNIEMQNGKQEISLKTSKTFSKRFIVLLPIISIFLLVGFDQFIKHLAVINLKDHDPIVLIQGVLELQYLENRGAAWGILQNKQIVFYILTIVFMAIALWFYIKVPKNRHYLPLMSAVLVLFSGAVGNFIDRVAHQYVVDFIYFSIIDFPVFNVADIYVTLSVIALLIMILFQYKDDDMKFLTRRGK